MHQSRSLLKAQNHGSWTHQVQPTKGYPRAEARRARSANQRSAGRLEIPEVFAETWSLHFLSSLGHRERFLRAPLPSVPCIESPRAFYHPVAAGVTPADPGLLPFLQRRMRPAAVSKPSTLSSFTLPPRLVILSAREFFGIRVAVDVTGDSGSSAPRLGGNVRLN